MLPRPQALGFIVYSANREARNRWLKNESVGLRPSVFVPACCESNRSLSAGSRALSSLSGFLEAASRRSPQQLGNW